MTVIYSSPTITWSFSVHVSNIKGRLLLLPFCGMFPLSLSPYVLLQSLRNIEVVACCWLLWNCPLLPFSLPPSHVATILSRTFMPQNIRPVASDGTSCAWCCWSRLQDNALTTSLFLSELSGRSSRTAVCVHAGMSLSSYNSHIVEGSENIWSFCDLFSSVL